MTRRLLTRLVALLPQRAQEALAGWVWQRVVAGAMREQRRAEAERGGR